MAKELTPEEARAQAERLFIEAAILMTRLARPMRRAVKLHLLHGYSVIEAAARVQRRRSNVYRALDRVEKNLAIVKAA